jgi:hypothetical protein
MHCILTNERGRQGILKGVQALKEEDKKKPKIFRQQAPTGESSQQLQAIVVQKYFRAFIDRKIIHEARRAEMEFLGMSPDCEAELELLKYKSEKNRLNRKDD